jgi:hypothetical protein
MRGNEIKKTLYFPTCVHNSIKKDGIVTCTKCNMKAIFFLTPLKKH